MKKICTYLTEKEVKDRTGSEITVDWCTLFKHKIDKKFCKHCKLKNL